MPARGADEICVREHDTVAGEDLAVAKHELAGDARAPGDDPTSIDVEAAAEDVPAVLGPDDVVDHARKEQRMEAAVLVRVEDEARDRLVAQSVEQGRRLGPRGRRRRRGLAGGGPARRPSGARRRGRARPECPPPRGERGWRRFSRPEDTREEGFPFRRTGVHGAEEASQASTPEVPVPRAQEEALAVEGRPRAAASRASRAHTRLRWASSSPFRSGWAGTGAMRATGSTRPSMPSSAPGASESHSSCSPSAASSSPAPS